MIDITQLVDKLQFNPLHEKQKQTKNNKKAINKIFTLAYLNYLTGDTACTRLRLLLLKAV